MKKLFILLVVLGIAAFAYSRLSGRHEEEIVEPDNVPA